MIRDLHLMMIFKLSNKTSIKTTVKIKLGMIMMNLKNLDHRVCPTNRLESKIKKKETTKFQMLSGNTFSIEITQGRFKIISGVSRTT